MICLGIKTLLSHLVIMVQERHMSTSHHVRVHTIKDIIRPSNSCKPLVLYLEVNVVLKLSNLWENIISF